MVRISPSYERKKRVRVGVPIMAYVAGPIYRLMFRCWDGKPARVQGSQKRKMLDTVRCDKSSSSGVVLMRYLVLRFWWSRTLECTILVSLTVPLPSDY
jgi:hypothetical protein